MGNGFPIPKEARGAAQTRRRARPGVGLFDLNDGGAIFGQPQERKPGFAAGSQGPGSVGKVGAKVRRVARIGTEVLMSGPVEGPRGPSCGDAHSRSWRAAVNGQGAATSIGIFPPREPPHGVAAWRGPCAGAKAQTSSDGGSLLRRQVPTPRGARKEDFRKEKCRKAVPPLKTR
jgi:hypothetical protein